MTEQFKVVIAIDNSEHANFAFECEYKKQTNTNFLVNILFIYFPTDLAPDVYSMW